MFKIILISMRNKNMKSSSKKSRRKQKIYAWKSDQISNLESNDNITVYFKRRARKEKRKKSAADYKKK